MTKIKLSEIETCSVCLEYGDKHNWDRYERCYCNGRRSKPYNVKEHREQTSEVSTSNEKSRDRVSEK